MAGPPPEPCQGWEERDAEEWLRAERVIRPTTFNVLDLITDRVKRSCRQQSQLDDDLSETEDQRNDEPMLRIDRVPNHL